MSTDTLTLDPESYRIVSPMRPLPRSAKKALDDTATILEDIPSDPDGRNGGVIVKSRPTDDLLDKYELELDMPLAIVYDIAYPVNAESVYYDPRSDKQISIYEDTVTYDGESKDLDPATVRDRVDSYDHIIKIPRP